MRSARRSIRSRTSMACGRRSGDDPRTRRSTSPSSSARSNPTRKAWRPRRHLTSIAEANGLITTGEAHVYRVSATGTVTDVDTSTSRGTLGSRGGRLRRADRGARLHRHAHPQRRVLHPRRRRVHQPSATFGTRPSTARSAPRSTSASWEDLAGLDPESLVGKQVALDGAFTLRTFNLPEIDVSELTIVPIEVAAP